MNRYLVGYSMYFSGERTIEVDATDKAHALEVARKITHERGEDYGGNLRRDTFRVLKKLRRGYTLKSAWD